MRDRETDKRVEKRQADPDEEKSGRERETQTGRKVGEMSGRERGKCRKKRESG